MSWSSRPVVENKFPYDFPMKTTIVARSDTARGWLRIVEADGNYYVQEWDRLLREIQVEPFEDVHDAIQCYVQRLRADVLDLNEPS